MFRVLAILLIAATASAQTMPQENVSDALAHAQALYYEARFSDSIQLLHKVNEVLRGKPDMQAEKVATKLQLALAHIGLNQMADARTYLMELYAIDPDHTLDSKQYSPKVIEMAGAAKAEQGKLRCQTAMFDARKHVESGNAQGLLQLIETMKPRCSNLSSVESEAADLQYKAGLAAYRRNEFSGALKHFKTAVRLSPAHDLASQYIDLTQSKLQVAEDRLLLQWQKNFDSRQFKQAASDYRQIVASEGNAQSVSHINGEYRRALTSLVDEWNRVCPTGEDTALQGIRGQINDLLPTPSFGEDLRGRMTPNCAKPAPKPEPEPLIVAATTPAAAPLDIAIAESAARQTDGPTCFAMDAQFALARLKTKVDPVFSREARAYLLNNQIAVQVKTRFDEIGNVLSAVALGGNPAINLAVENAVSQWKFTPVRDSTGLRCVDTVIPINIGVR